MDNPAEQVPHQGEVTILPAPARDEKGRILPGSSGNMRGRPPKAILAASFFRRFKELATAEQMKLAGRQGQTPYSRLQLLFDSLYDRAIVDDTPAAKFLVEYMVGKPDQTVALVGGIDTPSGLSPEEEKAVKERIEKMSIHELQQYIADQRAKNAHAAVVGGLAGAADVEEEAGGE